MLESSNLTDILRAGAFLVDTKQSAPPSDLLGLLVSRLGQYHDALGQNDSVERPTNLKEAQLVTAEEALSVVMRVQNILDEPLDPSQGKWEESPGFEGKGKGHSEEAPAIGTRDLAQLRTLLSIAFKWGVEPLLSLVTAALPSKQSAVRPPGPAIIDLTTTPEDYKRLGAFVTSLLALLFPRGIHGLLPQTLITTTILNRHLTDVLTPSITLGWLPKSLSSEATPTVDEIRPKIMRLLDMYVPVHDILETYLISLLGPH